MVSHTDGIDVETTAEGDLLKSLSRSVFGGESFFMNTFSASQPPTLKLAPALSGDLKHHRLEDETIYVQSTSFLASHPEDSEPELPAVRASERAVESKLLFPARERSYV